MNNKIKNYFHYFRKKINPEFEKILLLTGQSYNKLQNILGEVKDLKQVEFSVFSQWGEDGIIQYLISKINFPNKVFVEFGVENYLESNTRFLLMNNNWSGLVIDGDQSNINYIKNDNLYWKYNIKAICSFITKDNIDKIIANNISTTDIGILSIDIDGNDYWIWDAIQAITPRIVIVEFNNLFGCQKSITIPYEQDFVRNKAHYSNLYFGCSLPALCHLANQKGYDFVGVNSTCMNAFFVRKDLSEPFQKPNISDVFQETSIREGRNKSGKLNFGDRISALKEIELMPVYDIESREIVLIKDSVNHQNNK